jgi:hypothetical protein
MHGVMVRYTTPYQTWLVTSLFFHPNALSKMGTTSPNTSMEEESYINGYSLDSTLLCQDNNNERRRWKSKSSFFPITSILQYLKWPIGEW